MAEPRLQHRVDDATQNEMLAYVLEHALEAGEASVNRGPELLPILREAGVVDAGGYGLTIIFAGMIAALRGADPPPLEHHAPARVTHPQHQSSTYRYCTNFAVEGKDLDAGPWIEKLEKLGDSVLVVGDRHTLKVHVHTNEPERATDLFDGAGTVTPARRRRHARAGRPAHGSASRRGDPDVRRARRRLRRRHARAVRGPGRPRARRRRRR